MKGGQAYIKEIKKLYSRLKKAGNKPSWPACESLLEHLMVSVLSENTSPTKAKSAVALLLDNCVDLNDLRVSTPNELAACIDDVIPDASDHTAALVRVLNAIYERENDVRLERVKSRDKKQTRAYLDSLDGMTPYVAASTMLFGFGTHSIPVDEVMLATMTKEELLPPDCDVLQAQSFLEKHISANEARDFTLQLKKYALTKAPRTTSKKKKKKKKTATRSN